MNKILMVVYSWPPRAGVGMLRSLKFAKYLPEFGWESTILTPDHAPSQIYCNEEEGNLVGTRVIRTGYYDIKTFIKKRIRINSKKMTSQNQPKPSLTNRSIGKKITSGMINFSKEFLSIPDENIGWYKPAIRRGYELLRDEKFDIIYSTSPPESSHLIAKKLKKISGLPWIADLRDPWSDYHHLTNRSRLKHLLNKRIEKGALKYSDHIITISNTLAKRFKRHYKIETSAITNGFDKEDFQKIDEKNVLMGGQFTIIYTGKIHRKYQNPDLFFLSAKELINEKKINSSDISIKFYTFGGNQPNFNQIKENYSLDGILYYYPPLEYKKCLIELKKSNLTIIIDWEGGKEISKGVLPVKLFDYLGAKRPILTISSKEDSDLCKIIRKTNAGRICSSKDDVKNALLDYYKAFKENRSRYAPDEKVVNKYTRFNLTKQFAEILDKCIK